MLIENTLACSRFVGSLHLLPGVNEVTPEAWERNTSKCKTTIDALTAKGELVLMGFEEKANNVDQKQAPGHSDQFVF